MTPKKILVVDDHLDTRVICRELLTHFGYEVVEATDGNQAVDVANSTRPNLILLDFLMPNSDGISALERLREDASQAETSIILYTAAATELETLRKIEGVQRVLLKPIDSQTLLRVVHELIGPAVAEPLAP